MPRTAIPIQTLPANGGAITDVTWTAGDAANGMYFPNDGRTLLLVKNTDGSAHNVTVNSVADQAGRTGDLTIAAGASTTVSIAGPFKPGDWNSAGDVNVDLESSTGMSVAAVQMLPGNP